MLTLDLALITYGSDGIDRVARMYLPKHEGVRYIVSWQKSENVEVPRELAGRGIGSRLVEKVLADIDRQGLRLIPRCSFVAGYIRKNPRWERIVARE